MNFEEFKKRYLEKLRKRGFVVPDQSSDEYKEIETRISEVYVGMVIFSEWNAEQMNNMAIDIRNEVKKQTKKEASKIILPKGVH